MPVIDFEGPFDNHVLPSLIDNKSNMQIGRLFTLYYLCDHTQL